jgi:2-hydroxychromene-2-carboxylate isomerase
MNPEIDYYFTCISPFTYLGHRAFLETARTASARVNFRRKARSGASGMPPGLPSAGD